MNYINTKLLLENDTRFKKSERFGQPIIHNISSVHIPVEIYDGGKFVSGSVNMLVTSSPLKTFVHNGFFLLV